MIPLSKALPTELANDFKQIDVNQAKSFLEENGGLIKAIRNCRQFHQITSRAIFRTTFFQPFKTALDIMNNEQKEKFIDLQAGIQLNLGSNLVTYPHMGYGLHDYLQYIDKYYPPTDEFSAIFTLDMGMPVNTFEAVLEHLVNKAGPKIIALIFKEWENAPLQHYAVRKYFDKENVAFMACQVDREHFVSNASNLHGIQFGSFDLMAMKQGTGFAEPKIDLNKIRFISTNTLGFKNINETFSDPIRDIISEFEISPKDVNDLNLLENIRKYYIGARHHSKKFNILMYLSKFHEGITSSPEFGISQKFIKSGESLEYIKKKENLKKLPLIQASSA